MTHYDLESPAFDPSFFTYGMNKNQNKTEHPNYDRKKTPQLQKELVSPAFDPSFLNFENNKKWKKVEVVDEKALPQQEEKPVNQKKISLELPLLTNPIGRISSEPPSPILDFVPLKPNTIPIFQLDTPNSRNNPSSTGNQISFLDFMFYC